MDALVPVYQNSAVVAAVAAVVAVVVPVAGHLPALAPELVEPAVFACLASQGVEAARQVDLDQLVAVEDLGYS